MQVKPGTLIRKAAWIIVFLLPIFYSSAFGQNNTYDIYALSYAGNYKLPVSQIAIGAASTDSVTGNAMFWLLKGNNGRTVLIDAGFTDTTRFPQFGNYVRPDIVLKEIAVQPGDITDIVITHPHFDHIGGIDLFQNAMLWMQKDDFDYFVHTAWQKNGVAVGLNKDDVTKLIQKSIEGKLSLVHGDSIEIIPGIRVFIGSRHTYQSQYVLVNGTSGKTIVASDNIWYYYNLDNLLPIPLTFDPQGYVHSMMRMKRLVQDTSLIIPGHDALVFSKFPKLTGRVVRIEKKIK